MKRMLVCLLALLILCSAILTGCGDNSNEDNEDNTNATKNTLVFGLNGDPVSLDPSVTFDQNSMLLFWNIYDRLIQRTEDGEMLPGLAEKWEWNGDYTQLAIKLREGVKFHNGAELTAEDVQFSLDYVYAGICSSYHPNYVNCEVEDQYNLTINYSAPTPSAIDYLAMPNFSILCKEYTEAMGEEYAMSPVGTGPYMYQDRMSGDYIKFTAFEDYYQGPPAIKELTFKVFLDTDAAIIALETGSLDCLSHAPLSYKEYIMDSADLAWYGTSMQSLAWVGFQYDSEYWNDRDLRLAVAYGIDRDAMIQGALEGNGTPNYSVLLPGNAGYDENYVSYERDVEKAKEHLAQSSKGGGYTEVITVGEQADNKRPAEIFQDSMAEVGINIELNVVDRSLFLQNLLGPDWSMALCGPYVSMMHTPNYLWGIFHSSSTNSYGRTKDPEVDRLLEEGLSASGDEQAEIYAQMNEYMTKEAVIVIPTYLREAALIANKGLQGVQASDLYRYSVYDMYWS